MIETANEGVTKISEFTGESPQALKFLPLGADGRQALADECRRLEETGELYPCNVEIIYPPQVKAKYGYDGVVVDIYDILLWIADRAKDDRPEKAAEYTSIAEEFYAPDEEFDDFDGSLEYDVLEAIADAANEIALRG